MKVSKEGYKVNEDSSWPLAPIWPGVYAWELSGVARNVCNGLTPTEALQLAVVVCNRFVADGAPLLKIYVTGDIVVYSCHGLPALREVNSGNPHGLFKKNERCTWFKHAWATFLKLHSCGRMVVDEQTVVRWLLKKMFEESNAVAALDIHHGGAQTCCGWMNGRGSEMKPDRNWSIWIGHGLGRNQIDAKKNSRTAGVCTTAEILAFQNLENTFIFQSCDVSVLK
eukprot:Gb_17715 [translate_table: standard]